MDSSVSAWFVLYLECHKKCEISSYQIYIKFYYSYVLIILFFYKIQILFTFYSSFRIESAFYHRTVVTIGKQQPKK